MRWPETAKDIRKIARQFWNIVSQRQAPLDHPSYVAFFSSINFPPPVTKQFYNSFYS
jgi:hypothetical protein